MALNGLAGDGSYSNEINTHTHTHTHRERSYVIHETIDYRRNHNTNYMRRFPILSDPTDSLTRSTPQPSRCPFFFHFVRFPSRVHAQNRQELNVHTKTVPSPDQFPPPRASSIAYIFALSVSTHHLHRHHRRLRRWKRRKCPGKRWMLSRRLP